MRALPSGGVCLSQLPSYLVPTVFSFVWGGLLVFLLKKASSGEVTKDWPKSLHFGVGPREESSARTRASRHRKQLMVPRQASTTREVQLTACSCSSNRSTRSTHESCHSSRSGNPLRPQLTRGLRSMATLARHLALPAIKQLAARH